MFASRTQQEADHVPYGFELSLGRMLLQQAPAVEPGRPAGSGRREDYEHMVVSIAIALPLAMGGLCLLLALLLWRQCRKTRSLAVSVRPPGAGPQTTLLCTDIQNSSLLWESLPAEAMDQSVRLHHACLRALLRPFNGYESATEGDAFIVAFHAPADAARYALAAQADLMGQPWPKELLSHPDGAEVWVLCPPPQRSPFDVGALALARERERGTRERVSPEDVLGGPGGPQQAQQAQLLPASKRSLAGSDVPRASVMAQLLSTRRRSRTSHSPSLGASPSFGSPLSQRPSAGSNAAGGHGGSTVGSSAPSSKALSWFSWAFRLGGATHTPLALIDSRASSTLRNSRGQLSHCGTLSATSGAGLGPPAGSSGRAEYGGVRAASGRQAGGMGVIVLGEAKPQAGLTTPHSAPGGPVHASPSEEGVAYSSVVQGTGIAPGMGTGPGVGTPVHGQLQGVREHGPEAVSTGEREAPGLPRVLGESSYGWVNRVGREELPDGLGRRGSTGTSRESALGPRHSMGLAAAAAAAAGGISSGVARSGLQGSSGEMPEPGSSWHVALALGSGRGGQGPCAEATEQPPPPPSSSSPGDATEDGAATAMDAGEETAGEGEAGAVGECHQDGHARSSMYGQSGEVLHSGVGSGAYPGAPAAAAVASADMEQHSGAHASGSTHITYLNPSFALMGTGDAHAASLRRSQHSDSLGLPMVSDLHSHTSSGPTLALLRGRGSVGGHDAPGEDARAVSVSALVPGDGPGPGRTGGVRGQGAAASGMGSARTRSPFAVAAGPGLARLSPHLESMQSSPGGSPPAAARPPRPPPPGGSPSKAVARQLEFASAAQPRGPQGRGSPEKGAGVWGAQPGAPGSPAAAPAAAHGQGGVSAPSTSRMAPPDGCDVLGTSGPFPARSSASHTSQGRVSAEFAEYGGLDVGRPHDLRASFTCLPLPPPQHSSPPLSGGLHTPTLGLVATGAARTAASSQHAAAATYRNSSPSRQQQPHHLPGPSPRAAADSLWVRTASARFTSPYAPRSRSGSGSGPASPAHGAPRDAHFSHGGPSAFASAEHISTSSRGLRRSAFSMSGTPSSRLYGHDHAGGGHDPHADPHADATHGSGLMRASSLSGATSHMAAARLASSRSAVELHLGGGSVGSVSEHVATGHAGSHGWSRLAASHGHVPGSHVPAAAAAALHHSAAGGRARRPDLLRQVSTRLMMERVGALAVSAGLASPARAATAGAAITQAGSPGAGDPAAAAGSSPGGQHAGGVLALPWGGSSGLGSSSGGGGGGAEAAAQRLSPVELWAEHTGGIASVGTAPLVGAYSDSMLAGAVGVVAGTLHTQRHSRQHPHAAQPADEAAAPEGLYLGAAPGAQYRGASGTAARGGAMWQGRVPPTRSAVSFDGRLGLGNGRDFMPADGVGAAGGMVRGMDGRQGDGSGSHGQGNGHGRDVGLGQSGEVGAPGGQVWQRIGLQQEPSGEERPGGEVERERERGPVGRGEGSGRGAEHGGLRNGRELPGVERAAAHHRHLPLPQRQTWIQLLQELFPVIPAEPGSPLSAALRAAISSAVNATQPFTSAAGSTPLRRARTSRLSTLITGMGGISSAAEHPGATGGLTAAGGPALAFRGLRVRVGIHTGITSSSDVAFNAITGAMSYTGLPLKVAKAICDSAAGGMVLASEHCLHQLLPLLPLLDSQPPLAVYCGSVEVSGLRFPSVVMQPSTAESTARTASRPILSLIARVRRVLPGPTRNGGPEGQQQQQPTEVVGASAEGGPAAWTGPGAGAGSGGQLPAGWGAALSVGIGVGAARGATAGPPGPQALVRPQSGGVGAGAVGSGGGAGGGGVGGGGNGGGGGGGAGDTCVPRRSAAVYQLVSRQLRQRLPHMAPLRRVTFTQMGNSDAPVGRGVAIVFVSVPAAQVLLSDLGELGSRVLEAVKGLAVALCTAHGGYVVEATEGLCLAAFHDPVAAACWALDCVDNVKMQPWPTRLLMHPHGREVPAGPTDPRFQRASPHTTHSTSKPPPPLQRDGPTAAPAPDAARNTALPTHTPIPIPITTSGSNWESLAPHSPRAARLPQHRGPRLSVGIHVGDVSCDVHVSTGRLAYRGKVMNRAARIMQKSRPGQVLASRDAWSVMRWLRPTATHEAETEMAVAAVVAASAAAAEAEAAEADTQRGSGCSQSTAVDSAIAAHMGGGTVPGTPLPPSGGRTPSAAMAASLLSSGSERRRFGLGPAAGGQDAAGRERGESARPSPGVRVPPMLQLAAQGYCDPETDEYGISPGEWRSGEHSAGGPLGRDASPLSLSGGPVAASAAATAAAVTVAAARASDSANRAPMVAAATAASGMGAASTSVPVPGAAAAAAVASLLVDSPPNDDPAVNDRQQALDSELTGAVRLVSGPVKMCAATLPPAQIAAGATAAPASVAMLLERSARTNNPTDGPISTPALNAPGGPPAAASRRVSDGGLVPLPPDASRVVHGEVTLRDFAAILSRRWGLHGNGDGAAAGVNGSAGASPGGDSGRGSAASGGRVVRRSSGAQHRKLPLLAASPLPAEVREEGLRLRLPLSRKRMQQSPLRGVGQGAESGGEELAGGGSPRRGGAAEGGRGHALDSQSGSRLSAGPAYTVSAPLRAIAASSIGPFQLKGIAEPIEIMELSWA